MTSDLVMEQLPMDDTREATQWIIRCFEREQRDGHDGVDVFIDGVQIAGLPLDPDERIYGAYESKYFFTPKALIITTNEGHLRIPWREVRMCSSANGSDHRWSNLLLHDFRRVQIEFAGRLQDRIGELYHSMIERFSGVTCEREGVMTVREFFGQVQSEYELMPNLLEHPDLDVFQRALNQLEADLPGTTIFMLIAGDDPGTAIGVIAVTCHPEECFERFAQDFGADVVMEIDQAEPLNLLEIVPIELLQIPDGHRVYHIVWD